MSLEHPDPNTPKLPDEVPNLLLAIQMTLSTLLHQSRKLTVIFINTSQGLPRQNRLFCIASSNFFLFLQKAADRALKEITSRFHLDPPTYFPKE